MSLSEEERRTIVQLELERAKRTFTEVETLKAAKLWNGVCNHCAFDADPEELENRIEPARKMIETIEKLVNS